MKKTLEPEQVELLRLTTLGMDYNEISSTLQQEPEYVRWLLRATREALGAKSMPQAVALAYQRGLLPILARHNVDDDMEEEKIDG